MKYPGAAALAVAALALALGGSGALWLAAVAQGRPLDAMETEYLVAMPGLAALVLLMVLALRRLGPRPFLSVLWLSVGVQAAHVVFAFLQAGVFYVPAVAITVASVLGVRAPEKDAALGRRQGNGTLKA